MQTAQPCSFKEHSMQQRLDYKQAAPAAFQAMLGLEN
jgi:hypothetical protein